MRIQHNILAMNAYRNYSNNVSALGKNLERLSSGYRINRAGDDAAGLAISEKMRAQITGLNAAQKNVKDGISLVKTAEGAMQEIQDMLNRMDYLATQSANGTYDSDVDRKALQQEVDSLREEINRIANSANFNGIKLLNGDLDGDAASAAAAAADAGNFQEQSVSAIADHEIVDAPQKGKFTLDLGELRFSSTTNADETVTISITEIEGLSIVATVKPDGDVSYVLTNTQVSINGETFNVNLDGTTLTFTQASDPATAWNTDLSKVTLEYASSTGVADNNGESIKVQWEQRPVYGEQVKQAQGMFDLSDIGSDIKDGSRLKIGDLTFTFKVVADSDYKNPYDGFTINIKESWLDGNGNVKTANLADLAAAISGAAIGKGDFIISNGGNSSELYLTERVTGSDGKTKEGYELAGDDPAQVDASWEGVVSFNPDAAPDDDNAGAGLNLQIGDTSDSFNQMKIKIGDMHTDAMTYVNDDGEETSISKIDITDSEKAQAAVDVIKNAINYVSSVRGQLGAYQNRLEHTQNNLSVMAENIQDAESSIRDTDVAEEMMSYVKNNILVQSAQAMLAQANQVPQGVLQLLG